VWRAGALLPIWGGDEVSDPVIPGEDTSYPIQRSVDTNTELQLIQIMVRAVAPDSTESADSNIEEVCMPFLYHGSGLL
jgi:hypothetical protein